MRLDPITLSSQQAPGCYAKTQFKNSSATWLPSYTADSTLYEFVLLFPRTARHPVMPDDHSELVPLLPIPNRTVKRLRADDSAGSRVKVGHRQALTARNCPSVERLRGFCLWASDFYMPCRVFGHIDQVIWLIGLVRSGPSKTNSGKKKGHRGCPFYRPIPARIDVVRASPVR